MRSAASKFPDRLVSIQTIIDVSSMWILLTIISGTIGGILLSCATSDIVLKIVNFIIGFISAIFIFCCCFNGFDNARSAVITSSFCILVSFGMFSTRKNSLRIFFFFPLCCMIVRWMVLVADPYNGYKFFISINETPVDAYLCTTRSDTTNIHFLQGFVDEDIVTYKFANQGLFPIEVTREMVLDGEEITVCPSYMR